MAVLQLSAPRSPPNPSSTGGGGAHSVFSHLTAAEEVVEPVSSAQAWKPEITLEAGTPKARSQGLAWRTFCSAKNIIPEVDISSFKSRGAMQKWAVPHKKPCEFPVQEAGPTYLGAD